MERNPSSSSSRTDRKTTERNRRNHMKSLYSELNSLVRPHHSPRDSVTLPDQLDEAANYIKRLQERLEKMKERKDDLMGFERSNGSSPSSKGRGGAAAAAAAVTAGLKPLQIEVREKGSALEVVLITGLDFQFMFNETIRGLHEEGAETVNASFSVVDDTVFHTIHAQVEEAAMGNYGTAARISERLKKFV